MRKNRLQALPRRFYSRPTLEVAPDLLGKALIFKNFTGYITETEAYIGQDDEASHAARGITPRSKIMFGQPGLSYVYFIYGMYNCLNFVTEQDGAPGAVLIRGLYLPEMKLHLNGPGKLCRHLGITRAHNGIDIVTAKDFYIADKLHIPAFDTTPRIGISKAKDKPWRYVVTNTALTKFLP